MDGVSAFNPFNLLRRELVPTTFTGGTPDATPIGNVGVGRASGSEPIFARSIVCLASSLRSPSSLGPIKDVLPLGVFVAFDDYLLGNFHKLITVINALHVPDGFAARLVDHAERHRFLRGDGEAELDGDENERQAEIA